MIIGRVTEVDTARRVITVLAYGRNDDFVLRDVHVVNTVGQVSSTPAVGDKVLVNRDGADSFLMGVLPEISDAATEENEKEAILPGETVIGTRSKGVGLLRGGLAFLLANPATGVMAIDQLGGVLNILGDKIYFDSSLYHKEIVTEDTGVNTKETISSPDHLIDREDNSVDGEINNTYKGLTKLTININQDKVSPLSPDVFPEVDVNVKTMNGNIKVTIDQLGNVNIEGIQDLNMKVKRAGVNTDFSPLDGVVTGNTKCPYTKAPHIDCSKTVFVGSL
jgi:hypothetical protein